MPIVESIIIEANIVNAIILNQRRKTLRRRIARYEKCEYHYCLIAKLDVLLKRLISRNYRFLPDALCQSACSLHGKVDLHCMYIRYLLLQSISALESPRCYPPRRYDNRSTATVRHTM